MLRVGKWFTKNADAYTVTLIKKCQDQVKKTLKHYQVQRLERILKAKLILNNEHFCGTPAKCKYWERGGDVFEVKTLTLQNSVRKTCIQKDDGWGKAVLGRLEYAQDLPTVEAICHQSCSAIFRLCSQSELIRLYKEQKCRQMQVFTENAFKSCFDTGCSTIWIIISYLSGISLSASCGQVVNQEY